MSVIAVENLGKKYTIGHQKGTRYQTLRDTLAHTGRGVWQRLRHPLSPNREIVDLEEIWALRDVNFEIQQGERVGIIGRNGAGKSTLLKILSRITHPTTGRVTITGRVASLLEVGTGFHPELTGRENIYLNGAILGMTRQEIKKKFDEIVAFAEVEKFLDTPVKHYSSGMYVRLAFAVAAHLEPEILLVDEVLAVGDAQFQKKCLGKMEDVSKEGRTVLFVSHNMALIARLCSRVILLECGKLIIDDSTQAALSIYMKGDIGKSAERAWKNIGQAPGDHRVRIQRIRVHTHSEETADTIDIRSPIGLDIEYWNYQENLRLVPNFHFYNEAGICLFISTNNSTKEWYNQPHPIGFFKSTCWIPGNFLAEGLVTVTAAVSTINPTEPCAVEYNAVSFFIEDHSEGDGARGQIATNFHGVVRPLLQWTMQFEAKTPPPL